MTIFYPDVSCLPDWCQFRGLRHRRGESDRGYRLYEPRLCVGQETSGGCWRLFLRVPLPAPGQWSGPGVICPWRCRQRSPADDRLRAGVQLQRHDFLSTAGLRRRGLHQRIPGARRQDLLAVPSALVLAGQSRPGFAGLACRPRHAARLVRLHRLQRRRPGLGSVWRNDAHHLAVHLDRDAQWSQ